MSMSDVTMNMFDNPVFKTFFLLLLLVPIFKAHDLILLGIIFITLTDHVNQHKTKTNLEYFSLVKKETESEKLTDVLM